MTVDWSRFVGLPYRDWGRDYDGVDCWGLVFLVYRDALGVAIPSYADDCDLPFCPPARASLAGRAIVHWHRREAGQEQVGDAVLMRSGGVPCHVGVLTPQGMILHCEEIAGSVMEPRGGVRVRSRIEGFYHHG